MLNVIFREVLNECKATAAKRRKGSNRLEASGFTEEELFEQQQRLIAEAKQAQFLEEQQEYNQIQFTSDHIKSTAVSEMAYLSVGPSPEKNMKP